MWIRKVASKTWLSPIMYKEPDSTYPKLVSSFVLSKTVNQKYGVYGVTKPSNAGMGRLCISKLKVREKEHNSCLECCLPLSLLRSLQDWKTREGHNNMPSLLCHKSIQLSASLKSVLYWDSYLICLMSYTSCLSLSDKIFPSPNAAALSLKPCPSGAKWVSCWAIIWPLLLVWHLAIHWALHGETSTLTYTCI